MKMVLHKPRHWDLDGELIFGFLFILLGAAVFGLILHPLYVPVFCVFRRLTGIPCPACGSFRCVKQLLAGHIGESFRLQPLGTLMITLSGVFALYCWAVVIGRLPRLRIEGVTSRQKWIVFIVILSLGIINWFYLWMTLP